MEHNNKDLRRSKSSASKSSLGKGGSQYTLLFKPSIIQAKKPVNLNGPFDVFDIPDIREKINMHYKNHDEHIKQDALISNQFVKDLNLHEYFSKKSNWFNRQKFPTTYSLYSAMHTYLPNYKNCKKPNSPINCIKPYLIPELNRNLSFEGYFKETIAYESESKILETSVNKMK